MTELVFVIFYDPEDGYNAVEEKYSLTVVAKDRRQLFIEIKNAVREYFGGNFHGKVILREFKDRTLFL